MTSQKIPEVTVGDTLEFIFDLPELGKTSVIGEITYCTEDDGRIHPGRVCYGVKFLEMSLSAWSKVVEYCNMTRTVNTDETAAAAINETAGTISVENKKTTVKNAQLAIRLKFPDGTDAQAKLEDISFGGIRVDLNKPVSVNSQISLEITYLNRCYKLSGICVWSVSDPPEGYVAGIFFDALTKEQFNDLAVLIHQLYYKH